MFKDDRQESLISRGVIRCIDPHLRTWIVPWSVDNNNALLTDEDAIAVDDWRVSFYDMGDNVLTSIYVDKSPELDGLNKQMVCLNAFYCVVSCRELGMPHNRYVMCRTYRNTKFKVILINPDSKSVEPLPGETLEQRLGDKADSETRES